MELLGWGVVDAKEVKARKEGTIGFQKHLVVFRNNDVVINGENGDTVYPQVVLTNSHDGKNAFKFTAGLFRMICENGLVIATDTFEDVKVRHMGYDFETLQGVVKEMIERLPLTVECMNKMKEVELEEEQMFDLAKSFLDIRIEGTENTFDSQAIEDVLSAQRKADEGNCLWEVFNRVQENVMEGNFQYKTTKGSMRQARVIKNFKQDQDLNKQLFSKALEFAS
jgi:translation initiation factor IF-1